ncbi:hypothetical protein RB195_025320 [Necator americanus]|uniref:Uncharacterized protein n=1 Tax=Necator americanus TaxID=51031 RepID=A0ABR1ERT9_NECAM
MAEEAQQSFDVFQSLEFAKLFNMAALQLDCLSKLLTANDVRQMFDDPRIECAPKQVRSVLLEALLRCFRTDSVIQQGRGILIVTTLGKSLSAKIQNYIAKKANSGTHSKIYTNPNQDRSNNRGTFANSAIIDTLIDHMRGNIVAWWILIEFGLPPKLRFSSMAPTMLT